MKKNRCSGWRKFSSYEERRDSGREWRVRSSYQREETTESQHQQSSLRDVTASAWEALAPADLPDWSKPPKIRSVEYWDDSGAKEAWDVASAGRSPLNDPVYLYVDENIDWNARIPAHLLVFVDGSRYRHHRKPSRPRPRGPVLLGLETLVPNCGDSQPIRCELECGSWRM